MGIRGAALASVIGPFVGQNIGAGKTDRVRTAFRVSLRFSLSIGLGLFAVFLLAAGLSLTELFVLAIPLVLLGSRYFGIIGVFGGIGVSYLVTGVLAWFVAERVVGRIIGRDAPIAR